MSTVKFRVNYFNSLGLTLNLDQMLEPDLPRCQIEPHMSLENLSGKRQEYNALYNKVDRLSEQVSRYLPAFVLFKRYLA